MIQVAEMWCGQNGSVSQSWFSPARFQELFRAGAEVVGESASQTWEAQMSFLRSATGVHYDRQLFGRFDLLRRKQDELAHAVPEAEHTV